jgi:ATP-dependent Clp protease ATP-binding subunit ClpA
MENYIPLDPDLPSDEFSNLEWKLNQRIIGQTRAVNQLVRTIIRFQHKLNNPNKPLASLLFLGPTGVGKTALAHALAEVLFNNREFITRVDCPEFQERHEISKLIGAPPGYVGYGDFNAARLSPSNLNRHQMSYPADAPKINIVVFDEIEKASPALFDILLGILDNGKCVMGNGTFTDFTKSIVIMTSNLGSRDTQEHIEGSKFGFYNEVADGDELDEKIYKSGKAAVEKFFRPEFVNRLDKLIVFRSLTEEHMKQIFNLSMRKIQRRMFDARHWNVISVTSEAREFLLKEGTSDKYGVRELERTLERYVVDPITSLISSKQLKENEDVRIDFKNGKLIFEKQKNGLTAYLN